jgi:hypothetical protein
MGRGVRIRKKAPNRGMSAAARKAREDTAIPAKKLFLKNAPLSLLKV